MDQSQTHILVFNCPCCDEKILVKLEGKIVYDNSLLIGGFYVETKISLSLPEK